MIAVNVLGMPSKKDSLVIRIRDLAEATQGQVVWEGGVGTIHGCGREQIHGPLSTKCEHSSVRGGLIPSRVSDFHTSDAPHTTRGAFR